VPADAGVVRRPMFGVMWGLRSETATKCGKRLLLCRRLQALMSSPVRHNFASR